MGIVSQYFPDANRAEALAVISMFVSVGSISGPAFGGILITWASWRWIYLFNVPVGLLIVFAGMRLCHCAGQQLGRLSKSGVTPIGQGKICLLAG